MSVVTQCAMRRSLDANNLLFATDQHLFCSLTNRTQCQRQERNCSRLWAHKL